MANTRSISREVFMAVRKVRGGAEWDHMTTRISTTTAKAQKTTLVAAETMPISNASSSLRDRGQLKPAGKRVQAATKLFTQCVKKSKAA
jgi:hypothetical protein